MENFSEDEISRKTQSMQHTFPYEQQWLERSKQDYMPKKTGVKKGDRQKNNHLDAAVLAARMDGKKKRRFRNGIKMALQNKNTHQKALQSIMFDQSLTPWQQ